MRFYIEWTAAERAQFIAAGLDLHRQHPEYGKTRLVQHAMRAMPSNRRRTITNDLICQTSAALTQLGASFCKTWGELKWL